MYNNFIVITDFQDFCALESEWDELLELHPKPNIFLTHSWLKCWMEVFGDLGELLIFTHRENGKLDFIAPLMRSRRKYLRYFPKNTIHFIGIERSDYHDFVYSTGNEKLIYPLLDELLERYPKEIISLDNIVENSISKNILDKLLNKKRISKRIQTTKAPYILLSEVSKKDYYKKTYMNLKRRLEKDSQLMIKKIGTEEFEKYLDILFKQHRDKWDRDGRVSLFNDDPNRLFYRKLAVELNKKDMLDFTSMDYKNEAIALHFGFTYKNTFYYYKPTYHEKYGEYSPGNILLMELIKTAIKRGLKIFDFCKGEEAYKFRFAKHSVILYQYNIFNSGVLYNEVIFKGMQLKKKILA